MSRSVLAALVFSALAAFVSAADPIAFNSTVDGFATTSITALGSGITTLTTAGTSGARIYYTKLTTDTSATVGLCNVYLTNAEFGTKTQLLADFDTIKQECSCYWVDANDLMTMYPTLQSSYQYTLTFTNLQGKYNITSPPFGIQFSAAPGVTSSAAAAVETSSAPATSSVAPRTTSAALVTTSTAPSLVLPGAVATTTAKAGGAASRLGSLAAGVAVSFGAAVILL
ncbi:hypothetical protein HDU93_005223 [Gonapodya sp. JEL0774]|nr:hypothetical protein HDU93_005223 [Gonapodya sp. JEL0774]